MARAPAGETECPNLNSSRRGRAASTPDGTTAVRLKILRLFPVSRPVAAGSADCNCMNSSYWVGAADDKANLWAVGQLSGTLPDGLPVGAMTCLVLPTGAGLRTGPWSSLVGRVLLETVDRVQPVVYMQAHRRRSFGPTDGRVFLGPHYAGHGDWPFRDACCDLARRELEREERKAPSTLDLLSCALEQHERNYGPALALLDYVESARPYADWDTCIKADQPTAIPEITDALTHMIAEQRAAALKAFARSRADAPTVVVWHRETDAAATGEAQVRAASDVVIEAEELASRGPVRIKVNRRRGGCTVVADLPYLDWGFDLSDWDPDREWW